MVRVNLQLSAVHNNEFVSSSKMMRKTPSTEKDNANNEFVSPSKMMGKTPSTEKENANYEFASPSKIMRKSPSTEKDNAKPSKEKGVILLYLFFDPHFND